VDCDEGGSILSAPAKSFLKISGLETQKAHFIPKTCGRDLRKFNFDLPKVPLLHSQSGTFEARKWHFWKQFSPFFGEKYARFA